jgi:CheY-like chemotaxis protein
MTYVLAIEPNEEQATLLRDAFRARAKTKLKTVDSISAATAAIAEQIPQLVLMTSLLPARQESTLLARLRGLPKNASPQVLIIPRLAKPEVDPPGQRLLGRFRKRANPTVGCDPLVFADQLLLYLCRTGRPSRNALKRDRRVSVRCEQIKWASAAIDGVRVDLVDLSATGVQVVAPMMLSPGPSVQVHLSSDGHAVLCEANVVWGGIETVGPDQEPWYRAGLTFKAAYRSAIERFCLNEDGMLIA